MPAPSPDFRLPEKEENNDRIIRYLTENRGIEKNLVEKWISSGDIYEEKKHHNVVFVGRDADGIPRYAHCRGTGEIKYRRDVAGSDKSCGFSHRGTDNQLFVFEAAIDLLSFIQLFPKDWKKRSYLSLGGISGVALVAFLSEPYLPFGKLTIIQGNPGEGKTYFAMMLTAACTNRKTFPNMEEIEPFNVIYQTAEDGMGDTIKPRLVEAGADLSRVMVIDDTEEALTLSDDRIEKAIRQNQVRLLIIDPVQAFIGADVDMNRANEVRPVFRKLGMIAEKTGCAIVLIGI